MYKSILVPVDGSAPSRKALEVATNLIDPDHGVLHVLNVQERPLAEDALGRAAGAPAPHGEEVARIAGQAVIDGVCEGLHGRRMRPLVRCGRPADMILAEAEKLGADAIVMGSRGAGAIGSLVLGSVSQRVLHAAPVTVIVVR